MKTEIFGTFGPACKSKEIMEKMIYAGMTGMRLNLSHTTLEKSEDYIKNYQEAASFCGVKPTVFFPDMPSDNFKIGEIIL